MSISVVPPFKIVTRIAEKTVVDPDQISLRRLRDVVAGKDSTWSRTRAMALLLESDFPNKHRDYQSVLENEKDAPEIRRLAALYLGMMNTAASLEILIRSAQVCDEYVLEGVLEALGRIGNEDALNAIVDVQRTLKGTAESAASFAASFIAYRLGLPGHELPVPSDDDYVELCTSDAVPVRTARSDATDAEMCLRSLAYQPFGIEFVESPMYQMRCGHNTWMMLLNRDFARTGAVRTLSVRKTCIGIIMRRSHTSRLYATAFLLFTSPAAQGKWVDILVHRARGDLALAGRAHIDGDRADFSVRAIGRPRAFAVQMEGTLEDGRLEMKAARSTARGLKRQPLEELRPRGPFEAVQSSDAHGTLEKQ